MNAPIAINISPVNAISPITDYRSKGVMKKMTNPTNVEIIKNESINTIAAIAKA
jgi:hypothetical protein